MMESKKVRNKRELISIREYAEKNNSSIIEEWEEELNNSIGITLDNTSYSSHKKAYFKCKYCNEISLCNIPDRTLKNSRCGKCANANQTSYPEQLIYHILKEMCEDTKTQFKLDGYKYDICIDNLNLCIEYNSYWTHTNRRKNYDLLKKEVAIKNGYRIVIIDDSLSYNGVEYNEIEDTYLYREGSNKLEYLYKICLDILKYYNISKPISNERLLEINQEAKEQSLNRLNSRVSLLDKVPEITKQWAYDLNGNIRPEDVTYGSNKKYWFRCEKGHTYEAKPKHKSQPNPTGCKICHDTRTRKSPLLMEVYPELAIEYSTNNERDLSEITYGYKQKVKWICPNCGYEFWNSVNSRTYDKTGCKHCGYNWFKLKIGEKQNLKLGFLDKSESIMKKIESFKEDRRNGSNNTNNV